MSTTATSAERDSRSGRNSSITGGASILKQSEWQRTDAWAHIHVRNAENAISPRWPCNSTNFDVSHYFRGLEMKDVP